jgi:archaellum component FlaC
MAEVSNEPIDEVLKAVQARLGNIEEGVREVRGEVRALRTTVHGVQGDLHNLYEAYSALDVRVGRIERRLDIVAAPVS